MGGEREFPGGGKNVLEREKKAQLFGGKRGGGGGPSTIEGEKDRFREEGGMSPQSHGGHINIKTES